ncbi:hypothetical protein Lalb_Chr22g0359371 [Lupinus albus]|uniref:Uncharacterized protein n=1 Tax=Lupinus albus TaxID=3870 RepID=A0A6A4N2G2_LUPAL|nr:hypothetical protein Lalb_Chr22g0359371 [Lupinus albus]
MAEPNVSVTPKGPNSYLLKPNTYTKKCVFTIKMLLFKGILGVRNKREDGPYYHCYKRNPLYFEI